MRDRCFVPVGTFPGRKPVPLNSSVHSMCRKPALLSFIFTFTVSESRAARAVSLETVKLLEGVNQLSKNNVCTEFEINAVVGKYGNNQSFK